MAAKTRGILALVAAFAFLWTPLGQQGFLVDHWMKLGTFMTPFMALAALSFRRGGQPLASDAQVIALALFAAYVAHQFEEHWIDLYGNQYAFQESVNALARRALGAPADRPGPLSQTAIFVINTSLVWLTGAVAILLSPQNRFPVLAMAAIVLVNAVAHIGAGLASFSYNPGLATSVFVFIPIALFAYRRVAADRLSIALSVLWAVLGHVIMIVGMFAATWWGLIPPSAYYVALVAWSVVPAFFKAPPLGERTPPPDSRHTD
ncbi:MAG: HXXEE domain-containing protein [Pseudomonadota bacterium]